MAYRPISDNEYAEWAGPDVPDPLVSGLRGPTGQDRRDFADAHAEGLHDDVPREFCPECEAQGRRT